MRKLFLLCMFIGGCATAAAPVPPDPKPDCATIYQLYQAQQTIANICNRTARCTMTYDNVAAITMTQVALFNCYKDKKLERIQ